MKAVTLMQPGGAPIVIHFGPGVTIQPHDAQPEKKSIIQCNGKTYKVVGSWKDIAKKAGYDIPAEFDENPIVTPPEPAAPQVENTPTKTTKPAGGGQTKPAATKQSADNIPPVDEHK